MPRWYDFVGKAILERLRERYTLQDHPINAKEDFILHKTIQPVTQADELFKEPKILEIEMDLSVADGTAVSGYTVPTGKQITIRMWQLATPAAAIEPYFTDTVTKFYPWGSITTATQERNINLLMKEGWKLGAHANGQAADNDYKMYVYYLEEDAYRL